MLYLALLFLLVAITAAVFGFSGVAIAVAGTLKLLVLVSLVLFLIILAPQLIRDDSGV